MSSNKQRSRYFSLKLITGLLLAAVSGQQAWAAGEIEQEMRLSRWLNTVKPQPPAYLPGLAWMVPEEAQKQEHIKSQLLEKIQSVKIAPEVPRATANNLAAFVGSFSATGRVVVEKIDSRWLEVNPQYDPLLKAGQKILIPSRPTSVTVVKGDGSTCQVTHSIESYALDYVRRCNRDVNSSLIWVVQPDGLIQRNGAAPWNETEQNPPAPGAWIVINDSGWPVDIPEQVARLLATQGVAADPLHSESILPAPASNQGLFGIPVIPRNNALTSNDWGVIGLIQTPTARMESAGNAVINLSKVWPYTRMTASFQIMDWFGLSVRWIDISNRLYGAANFSGDQTYKDKSVDVKLKLLNENDILPQMALGLIDLGGTGLFAGEYLVSSKRTGNLDWSLGLGWGYLGSRGNLGNPLSVLDPRFSVRPPPNVGLAGNLNASSMFRGKTSLFGGVQYQTPWENIILKLEYDGSNYQHEPLNNPLKQDSPFNVGVVYRLNQFVDFAMNFERGNKLGTGLTLHGDLSRISTPKPNDPVSVPVKTVYPTQEPDWKQVTAQLEETTGWHVLHIKRSGSEATVCFQNADANNWNGYIDRIVAVLHGKATGKISLFRIQSADAGLGMHEFLVNRRDWVEAKTSFTPAHHKRSAVLEKPAYRGFMNQQGDALVQPMERFSSSTGMFLDHSFGGPEGLLYRVGVKARGNYNFRDDTWWTGALQLGLNDNYNRFIHAPNTSNLPRVRTQIESYAKSPVNLPVFQVTHVDRLDRNNFISLYGGMLESMFGGVGGEWLYRPWHSPFALGVDVNAVQQRGFNQDLSFLPYRTVTGHASLYWKTGIQDVNVTLHAGRYLAGDKGVTLDMSRMFNNGVKMGAFATKTNVTATQFGEGSFDKGVYVIVPFDSLLTRSSIGNFNFMWHPITRDGGAMLEREFQLFDITRNQSGDLLKSGPWTDERTSQFGDAADGFYDPGLRRPLFAAAKNDLLNAGRFATTAQFWKSMMWMGGITLASSVLDKPADKFAVRHGAGSPMKAAEAFGNILPFVALGASGFAYLGDDQDSKLTRTAYSSLAAGGIGLAGTLGLKFAIGRDRPLANQGPASFNFMKTNNGNASMPSGHTTIMWAAITPYAKAYHAPWLYGLAATTNLARIGGRNHWFSDTVAGSLLGYGIGSIVYQNNRYTSRRGMELRPTFNGVEAYWKMD